MSAGLEPDARAGAAAAAAVAAGALALPGQLAIPAAAPPTPDADERWNGGPSLPNDHPVWMRDALSLSQRARAVLATVKPIALRALGLWDHRVTSIAIGGRTLRVDTAGSYRFGGERSGGDARRTAESGT